jgi:dienelactone hydrolase
MIALSKKTLFALGGICWITVSFAQKQLNVLDWKAEHSVNAYLVQRMHQRYEDRRRVLGNALVSKEATAAYQDSCRKKFLRILGTLPERTSLRATIMGTVRQDNYTIEKVIYESFSHHHVTANMYIPVGKGPFPAALLFCGHEDLSKATESYQKTAILFAKNGFVVLAIDPISQSERHQLTDASGKPMTRGGTTEHTLLNATSNLVGTSAVAYELWDNLRGLDYLETRSEVDASRIGCLGNSGGGMQTVYFMGFEKRVKVSAVCSFLSSRERNFDLALTSDGCSQMPDEGTMQLEMSDYLIAAAPNPVLILAGRYDFIDYEGTIDAYNELTKVYQSLGQPGKVSLFTYDDGHGISKAKREAAITWFRKWLCNDTTPVQEPQLSTLTDKELFCTPTGQVNSSFHDEMTVEDRNLGLFQKLEDRRKSFVQQGLGTILKTVKELLEIQDLDREIDVEQVGEVTTGGVIWHKIVLRKQDEIPLPILLAYSKVPPKKVVVWLSEQGKSKMADSTRLIDQYLSQECSVLLCDIRGTGETTDKSELNDPKFYNREYRNAMLALHIGRNLVGQRVEDVLSVLEFIASDQRLKLLPIELNASGAVTLPALHALLFNEEVTQLNLHTALRSFRTIVQNPTIKDWYSYVIPNVLHYYDIPDLVILVGEERVRFVD